MKHYVLGFVFNKDKSRVLLVSKLRPDWQKGRMNGIGGKIDQQDKTPNDAISRECYEETGIRGIPFTHCITFVCPGGTVFVYSALYPCQEIDFEQKEDEKLEVMSVVEIHKASDVMSNLKHLIPLCLADVRKPIMIQQNTLGV